MTEICKDNRLSFFSQEFKWRFLIFSAMIGLFVFPIIQADVLFADDHLRAARGSVGLAASGRALAELLFYFLHLHSNISDTGALFQIASIFILAAPIALFSIIFKYNRLSAFVTLPFIVCTPLFLQNLSYRYDSLTMSLSMALAIFAVCVQAKEKYFYSILCLWGVFNFYQASFNVFLVLSCLVGLWSLFEAGIKASMMNVGKAYGCALMALIFYKIQLYLLTFSLIPVFKIRGYAASHSDVNYHFLHLFNNLCLGLKACFVDFNHGGVFLALSFGMIAGIMVLGARLVCAVKGKDFAGKIYFPLYGMMLFLGALICIIGPMALLENMLFDPRVMVAFGSFVSLCASFFVGRQAFLKGWKQLPVFISGFMLFEVILGAFAYGTVMAQENEFDTKIVDQMVLDTYRLSRNKPVFVRYLNPWRLPFAPKTKEARYLQPWINNLLKNNYDMFWYFFPPEIWAESGIPASITVEGIWRKTKGLSQEEAQQIVSACNYEHEIREPFYTLCQKENKIVIDFSSSCLKE